MARPTLRIEQPRYRIHVSRPGSKTYTVVCNSLDQCLGVIAVEHKDRIFGTELLLESRVGGRYRPRMLWRYRRVAGRRKGYWKREALAA